MKKLIVPLLLIAVLFTSCGEKASENATDSPVGNASPGGEKVASYNEGGISFDVPEMWQQNFKAVTRDAGSSGNTYPQTEFYYTENGRDIRLMSIGKFTRDQWEQMKKNGEVSDDAMIGESKDKNHIYSVFYEDHDYISDNALKDTLGKIRGEAEKLRDKIMFD
ncbi:MAG: hypothetical protein IKU65_01815 [Oscillospiraceae bacterium]|nr:hypothetical protein [Oscillospiraceae bacterium]